ncbi:putative uronyl 2-sulfotransferase-like [Apostichopus japonicus]|uniref:Putative uronyl 2-sulfotransferase-like n=1 Tax=Stichopus japonicus TaxID=307972 RepID=A0A2G8KMT9_STIJA|nr:putative uronyl 2-sulfotransferase-like [Apostichopus japonicus]
MHVVKTQFIFTTPYIKWLTEPKFVFRVQRGRDKSNTRIYQKPTFSTASSQKARFRTKLWVADWEPKYSTGGALQLSGLAAANFVIYYNAIPKTGCRSIARAAAFLSATQAMDTRFKLTILPEDILFNEGLIRQYVRQVHPPAIIGGHAIFVPFSAPQAYSSSIPVKYVNVLRDPLDRLISHYYFEQNGDSVHQASFFTVGTKMSLDDCLHDEVCKNKSYDKILKRTINQLCGARPHCGTLSRRAMLTAKRNVNHYTVIGLTEKLNTTVLLLERMFPSMMTGLHSHFRKTEVASLKKFKTLDKLAPSPATLEILRRDLAFEYEVYDDVKRKFDQLKAEMGL